MDNQNESSSSIVTIIIAWAWACVPLGWGILQTVHKAAALFNR